MVRYRPPELAMRCPECLQSDLEFEVRKQDARAVEALVWLVCKQCGYESGPYRL